MTANARLQRQIAGLVERGAAIVIGTVDADGTPRGARGWSITIVDVEGPRVRVSVGADEPQVVENLRTGPVAVTAADVMTFESVQLKGRTLLVEVPTDDDLVEVTSQTERFLAAVERVDRTPTVLARRMVSQSVVMIEIVVEQQFDQTPGPGAGARVEASSA